MGLRKRSLAAPQARRSLHRVLHRGVDQAVGRGEAHHRVVGLRDDVQVGEPRAHGDEHERDHGLLHQSIDPGDQSRRAAAVGRIVGKRRLQHLLLLAHAPELDARTAAPPAASASTERNCSSTPSVAIASAR